MNFIFQFYKKPSKYESKESIDLNWSNELGQQTEKVRCFFKLDPFNIEQNRSKSIEK